VSMAPWKGVTCNFIMDLSPSNATDSVLLFVDRMTKIAHLSPCLKSTSTSDFTQFFVAHIVRLHGLSDFIYNSNCIVIGFDIFIPFQVRALSYTD